jgi:uncharacterized protein (TIGR00369 family)
MPSPAVHATRFTPLPPERAAQWASFPRFDSVLFPMLVGLVLEEVRLDYARMRLPYRSELDQPAGVVHGGAIATLIDTVVVPAIAAAYATRPRMVTIIMDIQYLSAVVREDAIAEGWVEKRGRSMIFCRVEVRTASATLAASASLVYKLVSASAS